MSHSEIEQQKNNSSLSVGHRNSYQHVFSPELRDFMNSLIDERIAVNLSKNSNQQADSKEKNEEFLTRDETCLLLNIKRTTLWKYTKKVLLTAFCIGRPIMYSRQQVISKLTSIKKYSRINQ